MKFLLFIYSMHSGGAERVTANLAGYWAEKGWQVTVVTLASSALDFYRLHPAVRRVALDVAGDSGSPLAALHNNLRRMLALRRVLRELRPDVALAMMTTANVLLALAAKGSTELVTIGSEHTHPPQSPLGAARELARRRLYRHLTGVAALTEESASWLRSYTRSRNVVVIQNAAPWPMPSQAPHLPVPPRTRGQHNLLAVGRLSEEKGLHHLISIFQRLAADFPDWRLVILGEGRERGALEAQIGSAGLAHRISLPGRAGNVGDWYKAADLYVMSSRFEGFPNTLAEAMAHGLPAVSFDCDTGPRDIIRHEIDGLLAPANDGAALEAALRRLMANESLRSQFATRAIEARERFSLEKIAGLWEKLFQQLRVDARSR